MDIFSTQAFRRLLCLLLVTSGLNSQNTIYMGDHLSRKLHLIEHKPFFENQHQPGTYDNIFPPPIVQILHLSPFLGRYIVVIFETDMGMILL